MFENKNDKNEIMARIRQEIGLKTRKIENVPQFEVHEYILPNEVQGEVQNHVRKPYWLIDWLIDDVTRTNAERSAKILRSRVTF